MERIALITKDGFEYVPYSEIVYLQSSGNYCKVTLINHTVKKSIHVFKPLKHLEGLLIPFGFVRIHNEYLINLHHLNRYNKGDGGVVEMSDGKELEVSRGRKKEFLKMINGK